MTAAFGILASFVLVLTVDRVVVMYGSGDKVQQGYLNQATSNSPCDCQSEMKGFQTNLESEMGKHLDEMRKTTDEKLENLSKTVTEKLAGRQKTQRSQEQFQILTHLIQKNNEHLDGLQSHYEGLTQRAELLTSELNSLKNQVRSLPSATIPIPEVFRPLQANCCRRVKSLEANVNRVVEENSNCCQGFDGLKRTVQMVMGATTKDAILIAKLTSVVRMV